MKKVCLFGHTFLSFLYKRNFPYTAFILKSIYYSETTVKGTSTETSLCNLIVAL